MVTSYNELEAEEDEEVLEALLQGGMDLHWLWRPTLNPWRSLQAEQRQAHAHVLHENCYSQCIGRRAAEGEVDEGEVREGEVDEGEVRAGCRVSKRIRTPSLPQPSPAFHTLP